MKKKLLIIAGIVIFLMIIYVTSRTFFLTEPPDLTVKIDGEEHSFLKGSYLWGSAVADAPHPFELVEQRESYKIAPNTELILSFSIDPSEYSVELITGVTSSRPIPVRNNTLFAPSEPGIYVIEVFGKWPAGTGSYVAQIEVISD
ncbi:hypothetical protein M3231_10700 [Neobacillus mesonae]|nr:hypothetical protein [Neobacillus mesonae]